MANLLPTTASIAGTSWAGSSTPATLSAATTLTYTIVGKDVAVSGALSCVIDRRKFDGALAYPIANAAAQWSNLCLAPGTVDGMRTDPARGRRGAR